MFLKGWCVSKRHAMKRCKENITGENQRFSYTIRRFFWGRSIVFNKAVDIYVFEEKTGKDILNNLSEQINLW